VFFATSDSSLYHVVDANSGKPVVRQQGKAYMFSSPAVAGDVVFIGVLNGTLEARDAKTGDLLWDFRVEKSERNNGWVLTGDRKFNVPFLYHSNWREAPLVATDQQIRIGGIYSSSLVVNGGRLFWQRGRISLRFGVSQPFVPFVDLVRCVRCDLANTRRALKVPASE
jgi:outer membrane protein assembly factor BamB